MDKKSKPRNSFTMFTNFTRKACCSVEKSLRLRKIGVLLIIILNCFMAACGNQASNSTHEVTGTQAERVAAVSKIMIRNAPLPSLLQDANFVEEQIGDGQLGPSDFKSFGVLSVAPSDLPAWRAVLVPLEEQNKHPQNDAPKAPCTWWLSAADFSRLEFYSPKLLTGRINGWVGIAPDGRIFMYSFTM
jgi:hypothetical protein